MSDIQLAREWAALYRMRGLQPLPSRTDEKRPLVKFADWWEAKAPTDLFDKHETTNIQVMTGRFWRLLVIDLDGPEAIERFNRLGRVPRTWTSHSGGGGRHLWFRVAATLPDTPKAFLWRGDEKHQAIERLCDRSLVMAPPSIHPGTGNRYQFMRGLPNPINSVPADCPAWIQNLKPIDTRPPVPVIQIHHPHVAPRRRNNSQPSREDVLGAIHNKPALAQRWGLRIAGRPSSKGWIPCHAIGREDRTPSAAIHQDLGIYTDRGSDERHDFFGLAVALGVYPDRHTAIIDLGEQHHVRSA
ncbi:DNA primase/polymerase, bifunctional, N-terminal [uncultured Caudovirales phage]|uniref:DNA primase/polymerase, bifunctional, N-terminal n=1 Tax=uncultured Caudovirales phage TaxID=2100421 RepID=A0A6J5L9N1_9CAUD|nr:DNA primase/polymerase, bifunctional, N-terminal [uncultured Caudovirales phage]